MVTELNTRTLELLEVHPDFSCSMAGLKEGVRGRIEKEWVSIIAPTFLANQLLLADGHNGIYQWTVTTTDDCKKDWPAD